MLTGKFPVFTHLDKINGECQGRLAQSGERRVRNAEVVGSSPMSSTISLVYVIDIVWFT